MQRWPRHRGFPLIETFATQRLIAEKLRHDHLPDLTALHLDPEVSLYLGGVRSPEASRAYLDVNLGHWDRHGFGLWALKMSDGAFAGRAGIRPLVIEETPEIEIAYTFRRAVWGQGLATEIAEALTVLALGPLGLPSLVGVVMTPHSASRNVLEKCGYHLERGVLHHGAECVVYRRYALAA